MDTKREHRTHVEGSPRGNPYDLTYSPSGRMTTKYCDNGSVTMVKTVDMAYGYCDNDQPHAVRRMYDHHTHRHFDLRWNPAGNLGQVSATGKELDSETGYSYFGARYYDPAVLTARLSVDPMSDKYPSISPYAYCAWNPLKLVDPEGDTINVSRLSSSALEKYNANIQELQKSPLFSSYYNDLQNSANTYYIEGGAEKGGSGSFEQCSSTVSAKLDDLYALSQELFHAFQSDCIFYNNNDASVREAEGDLAAQLVMNDLDRISIAEVWSLQLFNYADDYAGILTSQFSKEFSNMVDLRIDFYKQRELQDGAKAPKSYIQANSGKPPLALQRAIRKSLQQY